MANPKAFTLYSRQGILRELKTECGVSKPFNAIDGGTPPEIKKCVGLWDTGASGSVITKKLASELGLKPTGKAKVIPR